MIIEIRGVSFINKGAELMLQAVIQRLSKEKVDMSFAMEPRGELAPYLERATAGLYQKVACSSDDKDTAKLCKISETSRRTYGLVLDSEIDAVLDASGLAYSDQMGEKKSVRLAESIKKWSRQGTKTVLLPQAFGPFSSKIIRDSMHVIAEHADLIFARDKLSYDYLVEVAGERKNIKISPDFTNLVEGIFPERCFPYKGRFCIVPNTKMIEATSPEISAMYVPFVRSCITALRSKKENPFILVHCKEDLALAELISNGLDEKIQVVYEPDPLVIKGILGACSAAMSSRFHGLVSALSQGVPSLATGWSHKYKALFEEYGFEEGLIHSITDMSEIKSKIDIVTDLNSSRTAQNKIKAKAECLKKSSEAMWSEVLAVITN